MKKILLLFTILTTALVMLGSNAGAASSKLDICHVPPGNPSNAHTITVSENAVQSQSHLAHGDSIGSCELSVCPCEPLFQ
jgi:hypothetical protein